MSWFSHRPKTKTPKPRGVKHTGPIAQQQWEKMKETAPQTKNKKTAEQSS